MSDFEPSVLDELKAWAVAIAVAFIAAGVVFAFWKSDMRAKSTSDMCAKLEQYTISVYAPKSMEEFNDSKKEAVEKGVMTESVANHFFASYGDELTAADLSRTCFASATYGAAETQSDGQERYLVSANLYSAPGQQPIKITIEFMPNSDGVISNYNLTVGV